MPLIWASARLRCSSMSALIRSEVGAPLHLRQLHLRVPRLGLEGCPRPRHPRGPCGRLRSERSPENSFSHHSLASLAGGASLWQPGGRRGQVGRPPARSGGAQRGASHAKSTRAVVAAGTVKLHTVRTSLCLCPACFPSACRPLEVPPLFLHDLHAPSLANMTSDAMPDAMLVDTDSLVPRSNANKRTPQAQRPMPPERTPQAQHPMPPKRTSSTASHATKATNQTLKH